MKLKPFIFILIFLSAIGFFSSAYAQAFSQSYGCEWNESSPFYPSLQAEYNFYVTGNRSCRSDGNRTHYWFLNSGSALPIADSQFTISFYREGNGNNPSETIQGILTNGARINFTRTDSQRVFGEDGRIWRKLTYSYDGSGSTGFLFLLRFHFASVERFDNFQINVESAIIGESYLKMDASAQDYTLNFSTESVLNEIEQTTNFTLEGQIKFGETGTVRVLDPSSSTSLYAECSSVSLVSAEYAASGIPDTSYEVECLDPGETSSGRGLFLIRNVGINPTGPIKFEIQLKSLIRINDDAKSINYHEEQLLNTGVTP